MENGLVGPVDEGMPQGGPLSPLLSNIVLDELDQELERRGLRFVRNADDRNVYVRSRRAGERVMGECGGTALGAEVSGIWLYERTAAEAADCAEGG